MTNWTIFSQFFTVSSNFLNFAPYHKTMTPESALRLIVKKYCIFQNSSPVFLKPMHSCIIDSSVVNAVRVKVSLAEIPWEKLKWRREKTNHVSSNCDCHCNRNAFCTQGFTFNNCNSCFALKLDISRKNNNFFDYFCLLFKMIVILVVASGFKQSNCPSAW